jgi:hypothetical protein
MPVPPKKPQTGRVAPGKPAAKPAPSARRSGAPAPAAAPQKNNMPLILGIAGGGVVILIILIVVFTGGSEPKAEKAKVKEAKSDTPKKAAPPDVSALEATGKSKCEEGQRLIQPRLSPDPSAPKDRVFNDLEAGLKLMNEGLEAYKKATTIAGKKYPLDSYQSTRDRAIRVFCTEVEREGQRSCEEGLKIVKATESRIVNTDKLSDAERGQLYAEMKKAQDLIRTGMGLFDRSLGVSGHQFDVTQYQEALKVIRPKLSELKPN